MLHTLRTSCSLLLFGLLLASGSAAGFRAQAEEAATAETTAPVLQQLDAAIAQLKADGKLKTQGAGWKTSLPMAPKLKHATSQQYRWILETNRGRLVMELYPDTAPRHVDVALYLTRLGFYDGIKFHRVIPGFMAQVGCPIGTGTGDPGFSIDGEFEGGRKHTRRGVVSTANRGPGTDSSQLFICFGPTPHLDGRHTIYGQLIEGEDALSAIEALGTPRTGAPKAPMIINKATVEVGPKEDGYKLLQAALAGLREDGFHTVKADWRSKVPAPPKVSFGGFRDYTWELDTEVGKLRFELDAEAMPSHVASLIWLTELGFYDGLTFHAIIPGFMAQGGCPKADGTGSPGYTLPTVKGKRRYSTKGMLGLVPRQKADTAGSQFFVTFTEAPHLDRLGIPYPIIGRVLGSEKTLEALSARGSEKGKVAEPVRIRAASIVTKARDG